MRLVPFDSFKLISSSAQTLSLEINAEIALNSVPLHFSKKANLP